MTNSTILYYPDLEPPLDWLKTFLLFHDSIARIVPTDVKSLESDDFKRFREAFPDAVQDIPSAHDIVDLDEARLNRLDKAFARIAEEMLDSREVSVVIDSEGGISFPGFAFLHRSKVCDSVNELLKKHNLTPEVYQNLLDPFGQFEEWLVVKQEASNLILSLLADRVARDRGLHSVTPYLLDYSLLALNAMGVGPLSGSIPGGSANKLLASAITTTQVPQTLAEMSLEEYRELRKEYADLREPFNRLIAEQLSSQQLDRIANAEVLARRIEQTALEFSTKLERLERKIKFASVKRWIPYVVVSLIELANPLQVDTPIALTLALVTVAVAGIEKVISEPDPIEKDAAKIHRRLVSIRPRQKRRSLPTIKELKESVQRLL